MTSAKTMFTACFYAFQFQFVFLINLTHARQLVATIVTQQAAGLQKKKPAHLLFNPPTLVVSSFPGLNWFFPEVSNTLLYWISFN